MEIPTFINEAGIETYIKPWHRPDIVPSEPLELPPWAKQEQPISFTYECCCPSFGGFYAGRIDNGVSPVPEASSTLMLLVGMVFVVMMVLKMKRGSA